MNGVTGMELATHYAELAETYRAAMTDFRRDMTDERRRKFRAAMVAYQDLCCDVMAPIAQVEAAARLMTEADRLCTALRMAWGDALDAGNYARMERIYVLRLRAIQRLNRRMDTYRVLVYGEGE